MLRKPYALLLPALLFAGAWSAIAVVPQGGRSTQRAPRQRSVARLQGQSVSVASRENWMSRAAANIGRSLAVDGGAPAMADQGDERLVVVGLEFDTPDHCKGYALPIAPAFARFDRYAEIFVPLSKAAQFDTEIKNVPGIVRMEIGSTVSVPPVPPAATGGPRGVPEKIVQGGISRLTGKGVIIAIVDTGVDFRNRDFITYVDGKPTSRLLYMWDTASTDFDSGKGGTAAPITYPNGRHVGTVYTREQLTADLRASASVIGERDLDGHGTSCAGVAAGNGGNNPKHVGVAPDADIITVRITGPNGLSLTNGYLVNAICQWLWDVAGQAPLVVSCSFGGHYGTHDGKSIQELQLSARFAAGAKGRAICIAAGNEGSDPIHAEATLGGSDAPAKLSWKADRSASVSLIFDTTNVGDIRFAAAPGTTLPKLSAKVYNTLGQMQIPLSGLTGSGGISLYTSSGARVKCDAYIQGGAFDPSCVSYSKLVGAPGTAAAAITVGSYDWNDLFEKDGSVYVISPKNIAMVIGGLSYYSSMGPSRDPSVVKPDIVSPGQFYSASAPVSPVKGMRDTSGKYSLFNGTSAATPYTAGIVALMFQKKPDLTCGEIKDLLRRHATSDALTGTVPNPKWGNGKLDLAAVRRIIDAIQ